MIKGNAEEYLELLKEDIQNIVCSETEQIEGLLPHLVHYKYEKFIQGICDDNTLTIYNRAKDDERKRYDQCRRRIAIKKLPIIHHEEKEPFETCIFSLNRDLAYRDLEELERASPLLKVKLESCYTTVSELLDVFYKSYLYAFCPINTEYIIAQLKRNILEKDISTEEKQQEINNFDSLVEKTKCFTLDNHKFIIYKISIIRE